MTDLSLAQHRSARCGFTRSAISTNYAALVIGRCGSIHSGFGSTIPQGSPRTRPPNFKPRQRPPDRLPHPLPYPGIRARSLNIAGFMEVIDHLLTQNLGEPPA